MRKALWVLVVLIFASCIPAYSQAYSDSTFNAIIRQENGGWIAGDATFSIALPNQKTLWLFGDSFIGTVSPDSSINPGASMIRNCALLQDGDSTHAIFGGTFLHPENFVSTPTPDSSWFWPEHGLVENDTLKIFLSEFKLAPGPAGFNFAYNAAYIGRFTYPGIELIDLVKLPYYEQNGVCYGNQVLTDNGYTYIYGRKEVNSTYHISYPFVARALAGNITGPWEFFTGISWVTNPAGTQRIISEEVSQQYGVAKVADKYVIINQEIWLSTKIFAFVADQPFGQWNNKKVIYETPILYPNTFTYNAFVHPQFTESDELLVSFNSNGNFGDIFKNVEVYRPRFVRIPVAMIDSTLITGLPENQVRKGTDTVILFQNYPNPAADQTKIKFIVTKQSFVSLKLCDLQGKETGSYVNKILSPGNYDVDIDLSTVENGVYIYRINNQSFRLIKNK